MCFAKGLEDYAFGSQSHFCKSCDLFNDCMSIVDCMFVPPSVAKKASVIGNQCILSSTRFDVSADWFGSLLRQVCPFPLRPGLQDHYPASHHSGLASRSILHFRM